MPAPTGPRFTLTVDHVRVARLLHAVWGGDPLPFGAPRVCPTRPIATDSAVRDIIRLLGWSQAAHPADTLVERATTLWGEMLYAVQVILQHAGDPVELGAYQRDDSVHPKRWERV